jgi:hypothetical protein
MRKLGMKRIVLVMALIMASEGQAQDARKLPTSERLITTKDDGQNNGSADRVHQGVRPPPSSGTFIPAPKVVKGKKKSD